MGILDLTDFSDKELSLLVFNDEFLYNLRHDSCLFPLLQERFIFTQAQARILVEHLNADLNEE